MVRVLNRAKTRRQRGFLLSAIAAVITAGVFAISALAVHDEVFQLDGDVVASTQTNYGPAPAQTVDWDSLFDASGNNIVPQPADFSDAKFTRDFKTNANGTFNTSDDTTFATGSKDTLPITPGWQCNRDNNVNSKIDVINAYTARYEAPSGPSSGDEILYFALERDATTGDANVGFWFLQDDVGCTSPGGSVPFTGDHSDGDLLVVSEFSGGGDVSTINVYRWNGDAPGSLGTTPVVSGADCRNDDQPLEGNVCAVASAGASTTPWLTKNKIDGVGNSLRTSSFFEGGLNLTESGLGDKCFNVFTAGTRSSTSLTATLFDFALSRVGQCTSATFTDPLDGAGNPLPDADPQGIANVNIPADPNEASITVKDEATITISGVATVESSVSFFICGPTEPTSTALCETGGVDLGSQPVTAGGVYESADTVVTSAGRYCFRAVFAGDASKGVPGSTDARANECFIVDPIGPTTVTDAGPAGSPDAAVDFGLPVTDTAVLSGTAHKPGTGGPTGSNGSINPAALGGDATGTLTFTLYKDDCSTLATGTGATNPQTVNVSGDGSYTTAAFTPDAPGTYHWQAVYSGDGPNTLAGTTDLCTDPDERVVVRQIPTEIKTKQSWFPNDTASIRSTDGPLGAGGSVVFKLYDNATCTGSHVYTETKSISGGSQTEEVSTSNDGTSAGDYKITTSYLDTVASATPTHSWLVTYTPAASDTAHTGKRSACSAENFVIGYTNDPGPGSNLP